MFPDSLAFLRSLSLEFLYILPPPWHFPPLVSMNPTLSRAASHLASHSFEAPLSATVPVTVLKCWFSLRTSLLAGPIHTWVSITASLLRASQPLVLDISSLLSFILTVQLPSEHFLLDLLVLPL